ncbi:MAG: low molecular weight protein-tyrosine-phosphatase [Luteibaculum sp.]
MMRVLFVCLGNICRSPLAEGILRHKAAQLGLEIEVDSCGTAAYHIGELPDTRSMDVAEKNGVDLSNLRARQFDAGDFEIFDYILVMDKQNQADVLQLASADHHRAKVHLFLEVYGNSGSKEVPDPYYGGEDGFVKVYEMLDRACDRFLSQVEA